MSSYVVWERRREVGGRPFEQRTISTPEGERPYEDQPFWISHASLPGLPAVVAPAGRTPAGLPVGMQVVGPCTKTARR